MRTSKFLTVLKYFFLIIFVSLALIPIFSIFGTSIQETPVIMGLENPDYTLINYNKLLTKALFPRWFLNTILYAGIVTLIKVFIDTGAGYAFARYKFPGSRLIFGMILVSMMMPFAVILFPTFYIITKLGLYNTFPGLILPALAYPFGIFLMRQFILSIPPEIEESARIDGCSSFGVLFRIILPLSRPGQAVLAIITFMSMWVNFIWPLIITSSEDMYTVTVGLSLIPTQQYIDWGLVTAGSFLSIIPMVIFFIFYQRGFIRGLTMGAVKE